MTGREITLRAIDFEQTDRVPVVGGFVRHPPFLAKAAGTGIAGISTVTCLTWSSATVTKNKEI